MKKAVKAIAILIIFLVVFPALAGLAVTALWNGIVPGVCGFASISFWQGVGLFVMGQILTGGVLFALVFIGGSFHAMRHHHGEWHAHWHNMTKEQRREFIERRRREHLGFGNSKTEAENAAE